VEIWEETDYNKEKPIPGNNKNSGEMKKIAFHEIRLFRIPEESSKEKSQGVDFH